jgi:hypothetical protein
MGGGHERAEVRKIGEQFGYMSERSFAFTLKILKRVRRISQIGKDFIPYLRLNVAADYE